MDEPEGGEHAGAAYTARQRRAYTARQRTGPHSIPNIYQPVLSEDAIWLT